MIVRDCGVISAGEMCLQAVEEMVNVCIGREQVLGDAEAVTATRNVDVLAFKASGEIGRRG